MERRYWVFGGSRADVATFFFFFHVRTLDTLVVTVCSALSTRPDLSVNIFNVTCGHHHYQPDDDVFLLSLLVISLFNFY